jgi:hypothetical protein
MHTAQVNEVPYKILCHNVACLIQSTYELGIEPTFRNQFALLTVFAYLFLISAWPLTSSTFPKLQALQ